MIAYTIRFFHSPCAKEEGWVNPIPPSPESSDIPQDDPEGSLVGITQNALDLPAYLFLFILHVTAPPFVEHMFASWFQYITTPLLFQ